MRPCRALLLALVLAGCAAAPGRTTEPPLAVPQTVALARATSMTSTPLNVSIAVFTSAPAKRDDFDEVRSAERRYLPVVLKQTLVESGYWGAVRVVPRPDPGAELAVTGEILNSNGVELEVRIQATDSRGVVWLDRAYRDSAIDHRYGFDERALQEPFQDLFNRIANDLAAFDAAQGPAALATILDAATLRYAIALSPGSFDGYLAADDEGRVVVSALPARSDAMYRRVNRIRESEQRFIDAVDEQYASLFSSMQTPYSYWRRYAFELIEYNRRIAREGPKRDRKRGFEALKATYQVYQDRRLNEDALREMADSFDAEVTPTVTNVAGRIVQLSGSLIRQYDEWRQLLREIYEEERGSANTDPPGGTQQ